MKTQDLVGYLLYGAEYFLLWSLAITLGLIGMVIGQIIFLWWLHG